MFNLADTCCCFTQNKIKYRTVTLHSSPVWRTWPSLPSHPCLNPAGGSTCLCLSYKLNETTKKKPYESKLILPVTTKTETDQDLDKLSCCLSPHVRKHLEGRGVAKEDVKLIKCLLAQGAPSSDWSMDTNYCPNCPMILTKKLGYNKIKLYFQAFILYLEKQILSLGSTRCSRRKMWGGGHQTFSVCFYTWGETFLFCTHTAH